MVENLIGQKVKLKEEKHIVSGKEYTTYSVDDPEFVSKVKSMYPNFRLRTSKTRVTADFNPDRINIFIDDTGIITRITKG